MAPLIILLVPSLSLFFLGILSAGCSRRKVRFPTPPGPKGRAWPIFGNLFDMPREYEWRTYSEWCRIYSMLCVFAIRSSITFLSVDSDIIHANVLGQSIIVIDKYDTAVDLLEKRSGVYSSR
jgi:hypothetical protein